ncbi:MULTISPECIES: hypothetical protein [unclassified Streptomyces]|uniref:hypothetical protein n=1 Tax=unclassified Streptomyces TaxID=2593676 RepID=UPI000DC565D1|nr:hypothetical protein [Streptomyces sp. PsTaAH-130]RAJ59286.1 hypothetical protein K376_03047 [Streptomyces sp. PsTaAH-130]
MPRSGQSGRQDLFLDQRVPPEARRFLAHTELPVAALARRLGFRDAGDFGTFSRRQAAAPPAARRAAHGTADTHRA